MFNDDNDNDDDFNWLMITYMTVTDNRIDKDGK